MIKSLLDVRKGNFEEANKSLNDLHEFAARGKNKTEFAYILVCWAHLLVAQKRIEDLEEKINWYETLGPIPLGRIRTMSIRGQILVMKENWKEAEVEFMKTYEFASQKPEEKWYQMIPLYLWSNALATNNSEELNPAKERVFKLLKTHYASFSDKSKERAPLKKVKQLLDSWKHFDK